MTLSKKMLLISIFFYAVMFFAFSFIVNADDNLDAPSGVDELVPDISELVILEYDVIEGELVAEQQVKIRFTIQNTSLNFSANNLTMTFGTDESGLYPIFGETNTVFVPMIEPGEIVNVEKSFNISADTPQVFELQIHMQYKGAYDSTHNDYSLLYLPVFGSSSFYVQVDVPTSVYVNTPMPIGGYCRNAGQIDITELIMRVETEKDGETVILQEYVLGSLSADQQLSIAESYSFEEEGVTENISFTFLFYDVEGNQFSLPGNDHSIAVLEIPDSELLSQQNDYHQNSAIISMVISIAAIFILCVSIFIIFIRRNRNS